MEHFWWDAASGTQEILLCRWWSREEFVSPASLQSDGWLIITGHFPIRHSRQSQKSFALSTGEGKLYAESLAELVQKCSSMGYLNTRDGVRQCLVSPPSSPKRWGDRLNKILQIERFIITIMIDGHVQCRHGLVIKSFQPFASFL